jgi:hypothetical protein
MFWFCLFVNRKDFKKFTKKFSSVGATENSSLSTPLKTLSNFLSPKKKKKKKKKLKQKKKKKFPKSLANQNKFCVIAFR